MRLTFTVLLALLSTLSTCACFAKQAGGLGQYLHQHWREGSDVPGPVVSMAQGRDGFIWLATGDGLFRFDGMRYEQIEADLPTENDAPSALLVTRSGDVWVAFETSYRFAVYRDGVMRVLAEQASDRIVAMAEGADGAIWALTANFNAEAIRFKDGRWRSFNSKNGLPENNAGQLRITRDGTVWIAGTGGAAWLRPGAERFELHRTTSSAWISEDAGGRIWISDRAGTYLLAGHAQHGSESTSTRRFATGGLSIRAAPIFDREGNFWVPTHHRGIHRFPGSRASGASSAAVESEAITRMDGLTSDLVNVIIEDNEGSIWAGTEEGIDRLRAAALVRSPALGRPGRFGDKLLAARDGTVYIGQADTVLRVSPGGLPEPIIRNLSEPEALCESPDGALWIALRDHVLVWSEAARRTVLRPDREARHNIVYDCAIDADGGFWMSAAGGGVHRYHAGRWTRLHASGNDPDHYPTTMARTSTGVVFQAGSHLVWMDASGTRTSQLDFHGSPARVLTVEQLGGDILVAGAFGVSRYRGSRVQTARSEDPSPNGRINGIARARNGDVWLAYPQALVRLSNPELEHAFSNGVLPPPDVSLGRGDGLSSRPHSHSQRSLVTGGDGRIWVATQAGTLWMDPTDLPRNLAPPGISITALRADGNAFRDPSAARLDAATSKIEIDYSVLSFADPERLQVRYQLEGFDETWVDPGTRRQAFYTNLPPGNYRFRVMASNNDGVWNYRPTTLDLEIPKAFFQTWWFFCLCLLLLVLTLLLLHRIRVAQAARHLRAKLEARSSERERIARELHDTLLQGVMGLILRFQSVANRVPKEDAMRGTLESALATADAVVDDARRRVHDLRDDLEAEDFLSTVHRIAAESRFVPAIPVRIIVEGKPRRLHPLVSPELGRILGEALLNIAQHAQAREAEIGIGYGASQLMVRVRDDGVGIPEPVLERGRKEGHFGLIGMRERAERLGGELNISSASGQGTELLLTLPARYAYTRAALGRMVPWWRRLPWRRK